ncbi:unnamed protein product, partial [Prorocentrum cordatum]
MRISLVVLMESCEGCSATAGWDQSWCYVHVGSNCKQYLNSSAVGETRKWRECGSCNGMTERNYVGDADGSAESYEGRFNCNQYLISSVAGEARKCGERGSCNCMVEFNCDGDADGAMESYSAAADWDQSWVYAQGGSDRNHYLNSSVAGRTRKWRECGSCNGMTEWNCDADADRVSESYEGCSATADWYQSWCYAQCGSDRNQYTKSSVVCEVRKWRECGPCSCMT